VLKIGQVNKVLTIEMVMEKSQENLERSVEGKGKSFNNLFAQELVGKTNIQTIFFQRMLLSQGRMACNKKERVMKNISSSQIQTLYLLLLQLISYHLGIVTTHWCYCSNII
jgi:hypothetical protein